MAADGEGEVELKGRFFALLKTALSACVKAVPEGIATPPTELPFGKLTGYVWNLKDIYKTENPEDALCLAFTLAVLKSLEETILEERLTNRQTEEVLKGLEVALGKESQLWRLVPEKFSLENLVNPGSEIYSSVTEVFLKSIKTQLADSKGFADRFAKRLKLNLLRVIERNGAKFGYLLRKLKVYEIEKYYREILNSFEEEAILGNEKGITLKDTYVEPEFGVYKECISGKGEGLLEVDKETVFENTECNDFLVFKEKNKRKLHPFIYSVLQGNCKDEEAFKARSPSTILVFGYSGGGKTSFCKKLISDYYNGTIDFGKSVYLLELKRLSNRKELINSPLEIIKKEIERNIKAEIEDFENLILVLDGLDEFCAKERIAKDSLNKLVEGIISASKNLNAKVVITSEHGIVDAKRLCEKFKDTLLILEIKRFGKSRQIELVKKYSFFYPEMKSYTEKLERAWANKDKLHHTIQLLSHPIFLSMALLAGIEIEQPLKRTSICEEFLRFTIERKLKKGHYNLSNLTPEILLALLKELAFLTFKSGTEALSLCLVERVSEKYGVDTGLLSCLPVNLRGEDSESLTVEFSHRSIREYATARYIYEKMLELIDKAKQSGYLRTDEEAISTIWKLFSHKQISESTRSYLKEVVDSGNLGERKELASRLKKLLPTLLEVDFMVEFDGSESHVSPYRPLYTFANFWIFAKMLTHEVSYIDELPHDFRQKFADLVRYLQSNPKTFVSAIPLDRTNLAGIDLSRTFLTHANLERANLKGANLEATDLSMANLLEANLEQATLQGATLCKVNLSKAILHRADLQSANLKEANLSEANLLMANLEGARLEKVNLHKANLAGVKLERANLQGANLTEANLWRASLRGADLWAADLSQAILREANLWRADLRGANLREADLQSANLWRADLRKASLRATNLLGANLWGADMWGANLREADLRGVDMWRADLRRVDLRDANLQEADLRGADLTEANIKSATGWSDALYDEEQKKLLGLSGK